jgi:FKBP-type peptidyl-prolyl cis-trans isomerase FkpA
MKMSSRSMAMALAVSSALLGGYAAAQAPPPASPAPSPAASPLPSPAASPDSSGMTEDEKTLYALGVMLGRNLPNFNLTAAEMETVHKGILDIANGRTPQVDMNAYMPKVQALSRARATAKAEAEKARSQPFLDAAAKEPGAVTTPTGLIFRSLKPGTGASPAATDMVKVHYHGTSIDGKVFDSSVDRGTPAEFPLSGVIPCWTEGIQKMKIGEKAKLVCPSSIGYGDQGRPPQIPPGATMIFEVELFEAKPRPSPPPRPAPPARPGAPAPGAAPGTAPAPPPPPASAASPAPVPSPAPAESPAPAPSPEASPVPR